MGSEGKTIVEWCPSDSSLFAVASNDLRLYQVRLCSQYSNSQKDNHTSHHISIPESRTIELVNSIRFSNITALQWHPQISNSTLLATGTSKGSLVLVDLNPDEPRSGKVLREFPAKFKKRIHSVAWNPLQPQQIAVGYENARKSPCAVIWDVFRDEPINALDQGPIPSKWGRNPQRQQNLSVDIVLASEMNELQPLMTVDLHEASTMLTWLQCGNESGDKGPILAVATQQKYVRLWDPRESKQATAFVAHPNKILGIKANPFNPECILTFADENNHGVIKVWDIRQLRNDKDMVPIKTIFCSGPISDASWCAHRSNYQSPNSIPLGVIASNGVESSSIELWNTDDYESPTIQKPYHSYNASGPIVSFTFQPPLENSVLLRFQNDSEKDAIGTAAFPNRLLTITKVGKIDDIATDETRGFDISPNNNIAFSCGTLLCESHFLVQEEESNTLPLQNLRNDKYQQLNQREQQEQKQEYDRDDGLKKKLHEDEQQEKQYQQLWMKDAILEDISTVMQHRARAGYSMDTGQNLQILSLEMDSLSNDNTISSQHGQLWGLWCWIEKVEHLDDQLESSYYEPAEKSGSAISLIDAGVETLLRKSSNKTSGAYATSSASSQNEDDTFWKIDAVLNCPVYYNYGRYNAIRGCSWHITSNGSGFSINRQVFPEVVQDCEGMGLIERAVAISIFLGDFQSALSTLHNVAEKCIQQHGDDDIELHDERESRIGGEISSGHASLMYLVAMCISGFPSTIDSNELSKSLWKETCQNLLQRPEMKKDGAFAYLRAICNFLLSIIELPPIFLTSRDTTTVDYSTFEPSVVGFMSENKGIRRVVPEQGSKRDIDPWKIYTRSSASFPSEWTNRSALQGKYLFHRVLEDYSILLTDRIAFACLYLPPSQLSDYLHDQTERCQLTGDLGGLFLMGLNKKGLRVIQSFVDITGDVQTAALITSRTVYPDDWVVERRLVSEWLETYRNLLNSWQLWHCRATFDVDRIELLKKLLKPQMQQQKKLPKRQQQQLQNVEIDSSQSATQKAIMANRQKPSHPNRGRLDNINRNLPSYQSQTNVSSGVTENPQLVPGSPSPNITVSSIISHPPPTIFLRCGFCNTSLCLETLKHLEMNSDGKGMSREWLTKQKPKLMCCPSCRKPLPKCYICLMKMGCMNPYTELKRESARVGQNQLDIDVDMLSSGFLHWFTWCHRCKHGGHAHHILQWFEKHSVCGVSGCNCCCYSLDK